MQITLQYLVLKSEEPAASNRLLGCQSRLQQLVIKIKIRKTNVPVLHFSKLKYYSQDRKHFLCLYRVTQESLALKGNRTSSNVARVSDGEKGGIKCPWAAMLVSTNNYPNKFFLLGIHQEYNHVLRITLGVEANCRSLEE